ncbi:MAG: phosphomannomutase, partial [Gemmatimonadaceae bacterium]
MALRQGIFRQYDIRGIVGRDLDAGVARAIGRGFAATLAARGLAGAVAVGRDNRPSGGALRDALVTGLTESGVDVLDIGVVPTPLNYWALHNTPVVAGIQITGSHNPPEYNGFKLSVDKASMHGDEIQALYHLIVAGQFPSGHGTVRDEPVIDRYIDDITQRVGTLSRPLRVVLDCGNGAGALVAPQLLERIGATVTALFCESDGTFPNHHPDPTVVENLHDIIAAVNEGHADVGVALDGDADRIGVIDDTGGIVWG